MWHCSFLYITIMQHPLDIKYEMMDSAENQYEELLVVQAQVTKGF